MIRKSYSNRISEYTSENGGRVFVLFLLFLLAIYQFIQAGFNSFIIICLLPLIVPFVYVIFRWRMAAFWALVFINYLIQFLGKNNYLPGGIPVSMYNEMLEIVLISVAIIDIRQSSHFKRTGNLMLFAILIWCTFCTLQVFNNTCNLGIDVGSWFTGARMMAFQLLYAFLVFSLFIDSPEKMMKYLKILAVLCLFSAFWTWKQQHWGFTVYENAWLQTRGRTTHILNGGSLIRFFSTFSDAANYGCNAAASAVLYIILAITSKIRKDQIFFLITGIVIIWGMFQSGTRTAIFCLAAGFLVFIFLIQNRCTIYNSICIIHVNAYFY